MPIKPRPWGEWFQRCRRKEAETGLSASGQETAKAAARPHRRRILTEGVLIIFRRMAEPCVGQLSAAKSRDISNAA